ncbi:uncharacterized protein K460DRAFT_162021 [Cucurbitaria berberidis CBS 394.84]|uniref:Microtubule associated protein n=1 Tax=Cucurbitaria berberidis CBS 394.84 TaxID=1168544 RepID=A0A9P4GE55_9PLEO|nr:uncharacterized protein K460DRAFT_162021 [Cucurbitaria berberidis CBS 394.84]KAF1844308.1 hypothetical protein K460DRAFT_162021 [Cucurbitaria berberidis CBS 394.84]
MVAPTRPPRNAFNAFMRKIYNPLGFSKAYNFVLWFIFAGALTGFVLARFMYLNFSTNFCPKGGPSESGNSAAPGECYYYLNFTRYKVGIILHLAGVLPACLLAVMQFTPFIRHRWIIVHRITGYFAVLLYTISLVGALMIARHAFGGGMDVQVWIGFVGIGVLVCFIISYINIKRLQIEQHRAWMLRGWFYAGAIITNRIILILATIIIKNQGYYTVWPCAKIEATLPSPHLLLNRYPTCAAYANGTSPDQVALVAATFGEGDATNTGAALNINFGMALWLAFAIHALGVEVYLHLTPKEAQRLRQVSYQRQLEAGMKNPGSAGLTANRLGDADEWVPEATRKESANTLLVSRERVRG